MFLKNFAVIGAGKVGGLIVEQLLLKKVAGSVDRVTILTRPSSQKSVREKYTDKGAHVVGVDYTDKAALNHQAIIAEAGKEAGAKLFLPSEFGASTEGAKGRLFDKGDLHAKLRAIGIPYLLVYPGAFADYTWSPTVNLDITTDKVRIGGDGNTPISFMSRPDIARFLVHVLTTYPVEKFENKDLILEGDRKSLNQVFKAYEEKTGQKLNVTYRPISEIEAALQADAYDFDAFLHLAWATGKEVVGPSDNALYPEWNPKSVIDAMLP